MTDYTQYKSDAAVGAELAQPVIANINEQAVLVNRNMEVVKLERYEDGRKRKHGTLTTSHIDTFQDFVQAESTADKTRIFIDRDQMQAVAILNFEADGFAQGHMDYNAVLKAERTVVFKKLVSVHDYGRIKQKAFAEFLEDWAGVVIAKDEAGNEIPPVAAINAVRNMRLDENTQIDSKSSHFRESRSRLESVEAKSIDGALPAYFDVVDPCYRCLEDYTLKLRFGIGSDDGEPVFKLEIIGLQALRDQLAQDFADKVADAFFGEYVVLMAEFRG